MPDLASPFFPHNIVTDTVEQLTDYTNNVSIDPIQIDGSFSSDLQILRQRVQLLEQRISQPTERESDLEMVLGNVWQALVRSGSTDAQPESPVWRLVRRFARNVLSTATRSSLPVPDGPNKSDGAAISMSTMYSEDWTNLLNDPSMPAPSKGIRSDSGYQTGM